MKKKQGIKIILATMFCLITFSISPQIATAQASGNDDNFAILDETTSEPLPSSTDSQVYQEIQAFDDYYLSIGYLLKPGETACLDKDGNIIDIKDTQDRVILENVGENKYRYYAYEDGYDVNVIGGVLFMKAGYSYSFQMLPMLIQKQAEVRVMETGELVGYALLNTVYDSNGAFTGLEEPIALVDSNNDKFMSIEELKAALVQLSEDVSEISESQPSLAGELEADIASAYDAMDSGAFADAYESIKQIQTLFAETAKSSIQNQIVQDQAAEDQIAQNQMAKGQDIWVYIGVVLVAVVLLLAVFFIIRRGRPDMRKQNSDTTDDEDLGL